MRALLAAGEPSALPHCSRWLTSFPPRSIVDAQRSVDVVQAALDELPSREARRGYLAARAAAPF
ncbi:MAG: hypothetical protein M3291_02395 [Actinomycetota bacterium]|nr:hypothetical protein [Actinomycetota bacterium]